MLRLKELRKSKGLSQLEFAKKFHASQNTVSQWENGTRKPSYDVIKEIACFFNVSTDYLLGNTDIPDTMDKQLSEIEYALYGEIQDLTDEEKQKILDFAKFTKSMRNKK